MNASDQTLSVHDQHGSGAVPGQCPTIRHTSADSVVCADHAQVEHKSRARPDLINPGVRAENSEVKKLKSRVAAPYVDNGGAEGAGVTRGTHPRATDGSLLNRH